MKVFPFPFPFFSYLTLYSRIPFPKSGDFASRSMTVVFRVWLSGRDDFRREWYNSSIVWVKIIYLVCHPRVLPYIYHVSRMLGLRWPVDLSGLFHLLSSATYNSMCCCSSSGWYRGEQDTADQVVPAKEHTQVKRMTDVRG